MARFPFGEPEPDTRRVGRVAWASSRPQIDLHTFNEPYSPHTPSEARTIRHTEVQPVGWLHGANTHAQREQYDATMKARGFGPEEDD